MTEDGSFARDRDRVKNEIKIKTSVPFSVFITAFGIG